jgi:hypothetical protein
MNEAIWVTPTIRNAHGWAVIIVAMLFHAHYNIH